MNRRQPTSNGARAARPLVTMILIAGFAVGISLSHTCRNIASSKEKSVPDLIRELRKQETVVDRFWHSVWRELPLSAKDALAGLQPLNAAAVRRIAAEQLRSRGQQARQAVPVLIQALNDPDGQVQLAAIHALGSYGSIAEEAVPDLIDFCRTPKQRGVKGYLTYLVSQSGMALAEIAPTDPRVLALMQEALRQRNPADPKTPHARGSAVPALERIAAHTNAAVTMLLDAFFASEANSRKFDDLSSDDLENSREALLETSFRAKVVGALGRIGVKSSEKVLPAVTHALKDRAPTVRFSAVEALGRMGPAAGPAVPMLVELARQAPSDPPPDRLFQPMQPVALASGPLSNPAGRRDENPVVQPVALSRPGTLATSGVAISLPREVRGLGQQIISTLGAIGSGAVKAVPFLVEQYRDKENPYRYDAAFARWRIDGRTEEILPLLADGLKDADALQRRRAARFLTRFGLDALPAFVAALDHEDLEIRVTAIRFCGRCGPPARHAIPKLEQALNDSRYVVRISAERALKAIDPERADEWKADLTPRTRPAMAQ